jgi:hypothetical protein
MQISVIRFGSLGREGNVGFAATPEGKLCVYHSQGEALDALNYKDEDGKCKNGSIIHWMVYDPMVYTFPVASMEEFATLMRRLSFHYGHYRISKLNAVCGSIKIIQWPEGKDWWPEATKVYKDILEGQSLLDVQ